MHSIILIDDPADVRAVLRAALESGGYRVLEVAGGREGCGSLPRVPARLVLADIVMREKDGIEAVKEILTINPAAVIFTFSGKARCPSASTQ